MVTPTLLVLAAGMGSRYGGMKQIDPVGPDGEAIMDYSIFDARRAGFGKVVFVIRKEIEQPFKQMIGNRFDKRIAVDYVFQEMGKLTPGFTLPAGRTKPWGTTHAILMATGAIHEPFAVINADDFYGAATCSPAPRTTPWWDMFCAILSPNLVRWPAACARWTATAI